MFSVPLELPEFKVVNQEVYSTYHVVHVEKKDSKERCPQCGFFTSTVHDRRTRKIRDFTVLNKPLYLMVRVKRYECKNCTEIFTAEFESIMPRQHYTNRFRLFLHEQVLGTTIQDVSRKHHIAYSTVERIFYSVKRLLIMKNLDHEQHQQDIALSLDEVSVRKGHKYETVLLDANLGAVMGMSEKRDYASH